MMMTMAYHIMLLIVDTDLHCILLYCLLIRVVYVHHHAMMKMRTSPPITLCQTSQQQIEKQQ